ncbi:MAG: iron hydrogenase small subunit [Lentisphaeria bacterium]|nr:iron hydrogenase small subunit [Lentisphaeria bacterium]
MAVGNADGQCQPMTWCFEVAPVNIPDEDFWTGPWRKEIQDAYRKAKAAGILSYPTGSEKAHHLLHTKYHSK